VDDIQEQPMEKLTHSCIVSSETYTPQRTNEYALILHPTTQLRSGEPIAKPNLVQSRESVRGTRLEHEHPNARVSQREGGRVKLKKHQVAGKRPSQEIYFHSPFACQIFFSRSPFKIPSTIGITNSRTTRIVSSSEDSALRPLFLKKAFHCVCLRGSL
jgi:hypothetical protein